MGVLHSLQQDHFIVDHLLIALDILFENNLDCIFGPAAFGFAHDTICARPERPAKPVLRSKVSVRLLKHNSTGMLTHFLS